MRTVEEAQFVFVDTPGFQTKHNAALNRTLNRTVHGVLGDVDLVLFVVEAGRFGLDDAKVLSLLPEDKPVVLIANKLDAVHRRAELAPWLKGMAGTAQLHGVRAAVGQEGVRRHAPVQDPQALPAGAGLVLCRATR